MVTPSPRPSRRKLGPAHPPSSSVSLSAGPPRLHVNRPPGGTRPVSSLDGSTARAIATAGQEGRGTHTTRYRQSAQAQHRSRTRPIARLACYYATAVAPRSTGYQTGRPTARGGDGRGGERGEGHRERGQPGLLVGCRASQARAAGPRYCTGPSSQYLAFRQDRFASNRTWRDMLHSPSPGDEQEAIGGRSGTRDGTFRNHRHQRQAALLSMRG